MKKHLLLNIVKILLGLISLMTFLFLLMKYYANKEIKEDRNQQETIRKLINNRENVKEIISLIRSRDNSYKYNIRLFFSDGTKLSVGDVYLKNDKLYYGTLFQLGNCTEPRLLVYDGKTIFMEKWRYTDISNPYVIEIYHNHNLSCLLEKKDEMQMFLSSFPFVDAETYEKFNDETNYPELIARFNISNCYEQASDGTIKWIEDKAKWVILDADYLFGKYWKE